MQFQPAEPIAANSGIAAARAPVAFDRFAKTSGEAERTKSDLGYSDDMDRHGLLVEQCRSKVDGLAPRQRDVLAGLVAGYGNKEIAHLLGISPRTIEIYRAGMMSRLRTRRLAQALYIAFVAGLMPSDTMPFGNG